MTLEERIKKLKCTDLFKSFEEADLRGFVENVSELYLARDELLIKEGEVAQEMFILLEGELCIHRQRLSIATIKPVDYVGEMALIETKPRSATVQANADSILLKITPDQFRHFFSQQPKALFSIMKRLSRRIRKDTEVIAEEFTKANILIHDMRNLMSSFFLLELLEQDSTDQSAQKYIHLMYNARQDLNMMMDEAMANVKRLHCTKTIAVNSFSELVNELMETELRLHPDLSDKQVQVSIVADLPPFPFSRLEIRRVLVNLILNAAQASKRGDIVRVLVSRKNGQAEVQIEDQGCGIPGDLAEKIFEPHYTTKENGNGLGLSSCRQIIEERHGGTLTFRSSLGLGTTFIFTLPLE
jgi:signal transduction histidine kinase